jgi:hypothetical protein
LCTTCVATTSTARLHYSVHRTRCAQLLRSDHHLLDAPRAYDLTLNARPRAPQMRHAAGAVVPRHDAAFVDPAGAATISGGVSPVLGACAHHSWDLRHICTTACAALSPRSRCPLSPAPRTTIDGSVLRFPRLPSTQEYPPHAQRPSCAHWMRNATGMCGARRRTRLKHQKLSPRTRGPPSAASYPHVRRAEPPTAFLPPRQPPPRRSVACAIRRHYQRHRLAQGTVYNTTTPRAISHATRNTLHAATPPHAL